MNVSLSLLTRLGTAAVLRAALPAAMLSCPAMMPVALHAQAAPAAATRALGTVASVSDTALSVKTDAGATVAVTMGTAVRVQQLAPGSTDLKTAEPATASSIAVGDRVLVSGTAADGGGLTATRVILMKSSAIAERNQSSQADWNRRGTGGIVTAVDAGTGTISVSSGVRKLAVATSGTTKFRRYAPGSVKFEDAKPGTVADIHAGDQLRARGERSADGTTLTAEEIVSGSFRNLSGTVASVNVAGNSLVVKDLATKKNETVTVGPDSDVRAMPPDVAARFAPGRTARPGGPGAGPGGAPAGAAAAGGAPPAGGPPATATDAGPRRPAGDGAGGPGAGGYGGGQGRGPGARTGADLSVLIPRMPKTTLAELKPGEALMIVASGNVGGQYTAITVLSGVEPLLTGPAGSEITLPPWSSAGGGGEAGGGGPE